MWEKPNHRKIEGTARPLRVAYLVNPDDCPDLLLDEIIAESFSRWAGRRTPIIPATTDGVAPEYRSWLYHFDADVIYSFVPLNKAAVNQIHEELAPGIFHFHEDRYRDPDGDRRFRIEMPIRGLSSLSVLPMFASRRWGFGDKPTDILTFDSYRDGSESSFLRENFGFLSTSFGNGQVADSAPELFACMTLISQESLENGHLRKSSRARYESDPKAFLKALAEHGTIMPPCQLSEMFSHYLEPRNALTPGGVNIVVGDTIQDRLFYWNGHNRFPRNELSTTSSIRISVDQANDTEFLRMVGEVLERRGVRGDNNSPVGTVRSTSLDESKLADIAERIKPEDKKWRRFETDCVKSAAEAIPEFWEAKAYFMTGSFAISREPKGKQQSELADGRAQLPTVTPWHLSENYIPPSVRSGQWMVDLTIERENDHCRFSNVVHEWLLPRRIRIDPLFSVQRENSSSEMYPRYCQRPIRSGLLSASMEMTIRQASITIPSDENALIGGLRDLYRAQFARSSGDEEPEPPKVMDIKYSDKGRYLLGTLQHFESLPDAFSTLMHDFWRETLRGLGANPSHLNDDLESKLSKILSKRLRSNGSGWEVTDERSRQVVVREALKIASQIRRPDRFIPYDQLLERYNALVAKFTIEHQQVGEREGDDFLSSAELDESIKYLCDHKVLFQGHEWQCRSCYNRNWISIDDLSRVLHCSVCQDNASPPVSGGWQFKASGFFVEAYSDHGTEAAIWALWRLSEKARSSFYFLPSCLIWYAQHREEGPNDCEVDLIAVVDGKTVAVEATTSKSLREAELAKLAEFAIRVRPDILFIVCGTETVRGRAQLSARLEEMIPSGVAVEIETYRKSGDHIDPYLPS
jgi:hypothetical protein